MNSTHMTRRGFVGSSAGLVAGLSLAGTSSALASPQSVVANDIMPENWDVECEALVVGAGCAGLSAALVAAQAGVQVLVIDSQSSNYSSSTSFCNGNIALVQTDEQEALGVEDSPETFANDAISRANADGYPFPANNEDAVWAYANNANRAYRMLKDMGLQFGNPFEVSGHSVLRNQVVDTVQMLDLMTAAVEEAGVEIIWETEFTRLITDGNGMVVGGMGHGRRR